MTAGTAPPVRLSVLLTAVAAAERVIFVALGALRRRVPPRSPRGARRVSPARCAGATRRPRRQTPKYSRTIGAMPWKALDRWLSAFFSSRVSSAEVRSASSGRNTGS